jgi:NAD(P)H-nitrite reductase large subunit
MAGIRHIVVVGASAAGATAAETVRRLDPDCRLTLISDEPVPLYSRCLLSDYLVGHVGRERLAFQPRDWPQGLGVKVVQDRAVELDSRAGEVRTAGGRRVRYDGLLLATGASGALPSIPGMQADGVFVPYRLDQVEAALAAMGRAQHVVVLGAGKVGVKAAEAAAVRGCHVTLVEQAPYPLVGILDEQGGALASRFLEGHGVHVRTGVTITEVRARDGAVSEVVLGGGERLPCQVMLVAVGVRPNADLAQQAGACVREGIVVDHSLHTSLEAVYAAGDVAEVPVLNDSGWAVLANWLNAVQQGRAAGHNLAGQKRAYPGGVRANSLRLWDLPIISVGIGANLSSEARPFGYAQGRPRAAPGDGCESPKLAHMICVGEVEADGELFEEERTLYRKLVIRDQRLVGLMQVGGDVRDVGVLCALVKRGEPVREHDQLLASGFAHFQSHRPRWALAGAWP